MAAARSGFNGVRRVRGFEARLDFGKDCARIFGARIVAGGDDEIASLSRGFAHFRTLGAIAIAAAAEDRHAPGAGFCAATGRASAVRLRRASSVWA